MVEVFFGDGWLFQKMHQVLLREGSLLRWKLLLSNRSAERVVKSQVVAPQCHQEYYSHCFASIKIPYGPSRLQSHPHSVRKQEVQAQKGTCQLSAPLEKPAQNSQPTSAPSLWQSVAPREAGGLIFQLVHCCSNRTGESWILGRQAAVSTTGPKHAYCLRPHSRERLKSRR